MHLSDLIPDRDSLVSRDYWWKRSHLGLPGPEFEPIISKIGRDPRVPEFNREGFTSAVSEDTLTSALESKGTPAAGTPAAEYVSPQQGDRGRGGQQNMGNSGGSLGSQVSQSPGSGEEAPSARTDVRISAPEIDWNYAVVERLDPQTFKTSLLPFDLGQLVLKHDASQDLALEAGDIVSIFSQGDLRVPLEQQTKYVKLEGEFVHAGVYSVLPGETLRDLVRRAGGLASNAYLYGSEFDRESTRVLQQQRIDEYVNRVDLDAERGTLALTASATSSAGSLASTTEARAAEQDLISRLKTIRATGRIVLRIPPGSKSIGDLPAIALENGDRFAVPPEPATINVVGAVNDQNSFEYLRRGTAGQYLLMAGGNDRDADRNHTFVIRADGSVVGRAGVKGVWGNKFNDLHLYPGDTIVVPDKTLRPTALRGLLDWTQIFSQLAIGAAAVNVLR
jgi:protein involved in polysaccharide export with SLBB domain